MGETGGRLPCPAEHRYGTMDLRGCRHVLRRWPWPPCHDHGKASEDPSDRPSSLHGPPPHHVPDPRACRGAGYHPAAPRAMDQARCTSHPRQDRTGLDPREGVRRLGRPPATGGGCNATVRRDRVLSPLQSGDQHRGSRLCASGIIHCCHGDMPEVRRACVQEEA